MWTLSSGTIVDWHYNNRAWIDAEDATWERVKNAFVERFRPVDYQDEIEERIRAPRQKVHESVRGYADRYKRLHGQGELGLSLDACRRYWIAGLDEYLKVDVMLTMPKTFEAAVERVTLREGVENTVKCDRTKALKTVTREENKPTNLSRRCLREPTFECYTCGEEGAQSARMSEASGRA
jgi:Retrotransposon gag protein